MTAATLQSRLKEAGIASVRIYLRHGVWYCESMSHGLIKAVGSGADIEESVTRMLWEFHALKASEGDASA